MRSTLSLMMLLITGGMLTLAACGGNKTTSMCYNQVPVVNIQPAGNTIDFTIKAAGKNSRFSIQQNAFSGTPAAMKIGDIVSLCVDQVDAGGHTITSISQFTDAGQPAATSTP